MKLSSKYAPSPFVYVEPPPLKLPDWLLPHSPSYLIRPSVSSSVWFSNLHRRPLRRELHRGLDEVEQEPAVPAARQRELVVVVRQVLRAVEHVRQRRVAVLVRRALEHDLVQANFVVAVVGPRGAEYPDGGACRAEGGWSARAQRSAAATHR